MKISKRDRKILIIGGVTTAVILVVMYGIIPLVQYLQNMGVEKQRLEGDLQRMIRTIRLEDHYKQGLAQIKSAADQYRGLLVEGSDAEAATRELHQIITTLAEARQISVQRITPDRTPERFDVEAVKKNPMLAGFLKVQVTAQLKCRPDQMASFLLALENHPRYFEVSKLEIQAWNVRPDKEITPQVTLATYVFQPDNIKSEKPKGSRAQSRARRGGGAA